MRQQCIYKHASTNFWYVIYWRTHLVNGLYSDRVAYVMHKGKWHKLVSQKYMRHEESYINEIPDPKNVFMHMMHQCVRYTQYK